MPKLPPRSAPTSVSPAATEPAREPRGARRKRETRLRLLEAALALMADKGMEGVTINEITEAADVGFGTFYNHFESKEAIYQEVTRWVFEAFADALDLAISGIPDPAEVIAISVRHTVRRAQAEPVWGRFLARESVSDRALTGGLGLRLYRDIVKGMAAGRFTATDPLMSFISVGGTALVTVVAVRQLSVAAGLDKTIATQIGPVGDDLAERAAAAILHTLGLGRAEAEEIARRPLPAWDRGA